MIKSFILILFFFFETIIVKAQGLNVDSLRNLLRTTTEDTTKVILISQISNQLDRSDPDSAIKLAGLGLRLAQQIQYAKGEVYCTISLATGWWSIGDYSTAIRLLLPNIKYVDASNNLDLQISLYASLTSACRDQGDYAEALKYDFRLLKLIEKSGSNCMMCRATSTFAAFVYLEEHKLDSAKIYMLRAFLYPAIKGTEGWVYSTAGLLQIDLHNYDSALYFYHKSVQAHLLENNLKDLADTYNYMATLFKTLNFKDSSLFYARQSLAISQPKKFAKEILETNLLLSEIYEPFNTDSTLHYYRQAMAAKDSLYNQEKQRQILSYKFNEELQRQQLEKAQAQYKSQVKIYILVGALIVLIVIGIILWRHNQHRKKAYTQLQQLKGEADQQRVKAEKALEDLKSTQAQLIQSEKMASLGELTAGIAHEIQNPLNFVNNFSDVNTELIEELNTERLKSSAERNEQLENEILNDIKENEQKINHHGKRADAIVKGMLQHSRSSSGVKESTNINALCDEYLRLAYHGLKAKDKSFNATMKTDYDENIGNIKIIPQDIGRVVLNLINNAFYAVSEKQKLNIAGYEPTVTVSTKKIIGKVEIRVKDNGNGIPQKVVDKIFQPFFTTKPTGQGTGLGLSLSYDIVKAHGGEIKVETKEGEGSEFIITLLY